MIQFPMCYTLLIILALFLQSYLTNAIPLNNPVALEFILLHNNDMHARFEQTDAASNLCFREDANADRCYGGFARVASKIKEFREQSKQDGQSVLFLNAGDTYAGSPLFNQYKSEIVTDFMNLLKPDVMSLGNHDFDLNIDGLISFIENVDFPVVAANIDTKKTPELAAVKSLHRSITLQIDNIDIGIIGYVTPDTKFLSTPNDLEYTPEVDAINAEAAILKSKGVNIIIALGHSGLDIDKRIAKNCPDVDLVVGGHSHTFLYSGKQPDIELPEGPYPVLQHNIITNKDVPIVQAYAFTKYLGYIKLSFDENGNLVNYEGQPILLNKDVPEDGEFLHLLEKYPLDQSEQESVIGHSKVYLNGNCRFSECNLGNLITDAMIEAYVKTHDGEFWSDTAIALTLSGAIRSSVNAGNISVGQLTTIAPFLEKIELVSLSGQELLDALEHSVKRYDRIIGRGEFLQMSGMHVIFDLSKTPGSRVVNVRVKCANCRDPKYNDLNVTKNYNVLVTEFLNLGGDGYTMFNKPALKLNVSIEEVTSIYIKHLQMFYPSSEDRIILNGLENLYLQGNSANRISSSTIKSMILLCIVALFFSKHTTL